MTKKFDTNKKNETAPVTRSKLRAPASVKVCSDCGEEGETVGHMGCQYPGDDR